jgi:hypothetical protein
MRRFFPILALLLGLSLVAPRVTAQEATPTSPFAELGLPSLDVTVAGTSYESSPAAEGGEGGGAPPFMFESVMSTCWSLMRCQRRRGTALRRAPASIRER